MHRCFMALELDDEVKHALKAAVEPFKRASRAEKPKLVDMTGYHVTLKFLGAVTEERLAKLRRELPRILATARAIETGWAGFAGFPRRANANVLVAVLRDDFGQLFELFESVEQGCEELGFPRETRPFKPHATLARFRTSVDLRPFLLGGPPAGPVPLTAVTLYESVLAPGGAQYSVLERYPLAVRTATPPEQSEA